MKKIFVYISALVLASSCGDITSLNTDPKKASEVPGEMLFSSAEKNLFDNMTSNSVSLNIFRLLSQQQAQTTYPQESRYDFGTRNVPQNFYNALYRDVLKDLSAAKQLIKADSALTPEEAIIKSNKLLIADVLEVYTYFILVTCYGDVPYTATMDLNNLAPKFDDQQTIYNDLLARLKTDVDGLDVSQPGYGNADIMYKGSIAAWIKFTNTLRVKMALVIADADAPKAVEVFNDAIGNIFTSPADNARLQYLGAQPNTNPIWVDLVASKRKDYVITKNLIDPMNATNDPRRPFYYTTVGGIYKGGVYGAGNTYANFSHVSDKVTSPTFEALLIDYVEVEFMLAEAAARGGFNVTGTAEEHYNKAVTGSIVYWGGTTADALTYLAQPTVNYTLQAGTWQQKIGLQKYIALYNRGYDAWLEWRRFDAPALTPPPDMGDEFVPVRFTYPTSEQNLNKANYDAAAAAIGGDKFTTKLFWDKF